MGGGKIYRIRKNVIHLMRGQIFEIEGNYIFTMGGAYSIDKVMRQEGVSWWPQEMPSEEEYEEARLNFFLEWIRENTEYKHWFFGHLHRDEDLWRKQSVLWFDVRNMLTNESVFEEEGAKKYF